MNILITVPVEERHLEGFKAICPDAEYTVVPRPQVTEAQVKNADVIIGNVPPAFVKGAEKLKLLQLNSAGTDGYTAPGIIPEGAALCNATGAYGLAISEHMIGMLLTLMKKLHLYMADQQVPVWDDHGQVTSIEGATTLVVGLGDIGGDFARKLNALGSTVIGIRRNKAEKPEYLESLHTMEELDELLPQADIVASCLPGTAATYKLFNADRFAKMKEGAFFLNIGRGTAVDQDALAAALNSDHLAGAGVDVTDPEPLPADHPLWKAKNMLITPHISGNFHLQETLERIIRIGQRNLKNLLEGKEFENLVDFETGYRKFTGK